MAKIQSTNKNKEEEKILMKNNKHYSTKKKTKALQTHVVKNINRTREEPCPVQAAYEITKTEKEHNRTTGQFVCEIINATYPTPCIVTPREYSIGGNCQNCKIVKTLGRWKTMKARQMCGGKHSICRKQNNNEG